MTEEEKLKQIEKNIERVEEIKKRLIEIQDQKKVDKLTEKLNDNQPK
jgi:mevalonate kinase